MADIQVQRIDTPEGETKWDHYVAGHPNSTAYHVSGWGGIIKKVCGHSTYYYMATGMGGEVKGILPLVHLKSSLFGSFLVSLPYLNYGGVVADGEQYREALLTYSTNEAKALGVSHIELRHEEHVGCDWPKKDHKVSMRLDLPHQFEDLMKSFPPKLRSQVRRGEKEGMTSQVGGIELLDDFYQVFALNMRDLGTPVYGKRWFAEILTTFPKDAKICVVSLRGKPLASGFLYGFRDRLEIPWASSDRTYAKFAPNMMLYGVVLRYACDQGYRWFDFGRSTKESGTYRFKEQWGAKPVQLYWHYWLKNGGSLPEINPQNPKYQLAIRAWQQLPVSVTTLVGPHISKYLP